MLRNYIKISYKLILILLIILLFKHNQKLYASSKEKSKIVKSNVKVDKVNENNKNLNENKTNTTNEVDIKSSIQKFYTASFNEKKREQFKKIIDDYKKNKKKADNAYSLFVLGLIYELASNYDLAINSFEKLIKTYPKSKYAYLSKERISECLLAKGERDKAIENYLDYYKWRISEGKKEQILFKIGEIYNQTLTTFEKLINAYKMAALRYEFSKNETIEYLIGYFKGFHLLDAHMATTYYRQVLKNYPNGLYRLDALLNLALIFAYDLSDIITAKSMLERLLNEEEGYIASNIVYEKKRKAHLIYGLLSLFHLPEIFEKDAELHFKTILETGMKDTESVMAAYYLGYYYEHLPSTQRLFGSDLKDKHFKVKYNEKDNIKPEKYLFEIKNEKEDNTINKAILSYLLGLNLNYDEFYQEECAFRASLMFINYYNDTTSASLIYKNIKSKFKKLRREKDFNELFNKKIPAIFNQKFSLLIAKEKKYYENMEYEKAILVHEEIIKKSKDGIEAELSMLQIARIYEEDLKEYEKAIETYKKFIEKFPNSSRIDKAKYQIAKIYSLALLDYNEAIKYYKDIISNGKDQLWIYQAATDLAYLYSLPIFKKENEAIKIYQEILKKVPMREDEVLYKLAEIYIKNPKEETKAFELCEKIVKNYPGSIYFEDALNILLKKYYSENLKEISKKVILAKEKKEFDLKSVLLEKLEKEKFIKNYKEAINTIDELKKIANSTLEIQMLEKEAILIQIEGLGEVEKGIKALNELKEKAVNDEILSEILFVLAKTIAKYEKDYKKAADIYEEIVKMDKLHTKTQMMALFELGLIYAINLKYYDDAFRCYSLIMSKYEKEARDEKLDAKIANLLNVDIDVLNNYLKTISDKFKIKNNELQKTTLEVEVNQKTSEVTLLDSLYDYSSKIKNIFNKNLIDKKEDNIIDELNENLPMLEREIEFEYSWFQKPTHIEYSWFQKPIDLSDIGIKTISWFKKGMLTKEKQKQLIDEETEQLKREMTLPLVNSIKTNKYLSYIELNQNSPKLPIVMWYLAYSYYENQNFEEAIKTCQNIINNYNQYDEIVFNAYQLLTKIFASHYKQFERALYHIRKMQEKFPQFFNKADDLILEVENYRKIFENDQYIKSHIGEEKSLDLLEENAKIYEEKLKDYHNAINCLNNCAAYVSGDTDEIKYKLKIAQIYKEKLKDYKLFCEEYEDILKRFPEYEENGTIIYELAKVYIEELNYKDYGIKLLEKYRDNYKKDKNYQDAMLLLKSAYNDNQLEQKVLTVQTLKDVIPELKLSEEIKQEFKKIEVEKKVKDILEIIEKSEENPENNYHYYYYIARMYERDALLYDKAATYYRKLIDLINIPSEFLIKGITSLGLLYETKLNTPKKAIELYREFVVKNVPDDIDFLSFLQFKIGECYELLKKRDEAIDAYRKVKFYFPISRWAKLAETRIDQIIRTPGKFITEQKIGVEEELEEVITSKVSKGTFEVLLETGEISLTSAEIEINNEKDPEIKIEKLEALINTLAEKDPKLPKYLLELAKVCEQTQKFDKAVEALKRIIDNFPKYPRYYDVVLKVAEMYRLAGNIDEAIKYYYQIVQESPRYDKTEYVRYTLGNLYAKKQEYVNALEVFRELIDKYQDSVYAKKAQFEKGMINARYMKDYDAAISDFEKMVERYFDHENAVDAQIEIGWIYENAKYDLIKAREAYQKALDKFPSTPRRREIIEAIERINSKLPKQ